ncbi:MAG: CDP-diacylglycerol--glycerol-3-phosphate 3-phosphatidyltransferase [Candidatus Brocadiae bacterium]|nr:CDP-diacylglycerol--glycerol-3-phosphate 3-phosphatidyltransferase [Candidatus Brocadiia bacterium]
MNLANQITLSRLIIAIVLFVLLTLVDSQKSLQSAETFSFLMDISLVLFILGAGSDYLDGYVARKYNMYTAFGRIADPLVDKIIIGGLFVFFVRLTPLISPWMVVVILAREMLVSSLRSYLESHGVNFAANWGGKIKMVLQCISAGVILFYLGHWQGSEIASWIVSILVWITLAMTVGSSFPYFIKAFHLIKSKKLA